jgi:hypothetical protein
MVRIKIFTLVCFLIVSFTQGLSETADFKKLKRLQKQLSRVSSMIFVMFCNKTWDISSRKSLLAEKLQSRFIFLRQQIRKFDLNQRVCPDIYQPERGLFEFSILSFHENRILGQCNVKEVPNKCHLLTEPDGPGGLIKPGWLFIG